MLRLMMISGVGVTIETRTSLKSCKKRTSGSSDGLGPATSPLP
jgi:hypothetical protein